MRAPRSVPSQLKVLIAEGTPIAMVMSEKAKAEYGLMPLMNMWWPQTMNPRMPIAMMAYTMARYPKIGLREKVESCLLYTSDAADERSSVDLGGRRIIKKKKNTK